MNIFIELYCILFYTATLKQRNRPFLTHNKTYALSILSICCFILVQPCLSTILFFHEINTHTHTHREKIQTPFSLFQNFNNKTCVLQFRIKSK